MSRDAYRARRRVLEMLASPPNLEFSPRDHPRISLVEPALARPFQHPSNLREGNKHPVLTQMAKMLRHGTGKLEYGATTEAEWDRYFRFASDRLDRVKGVLQVVRHPAAGDEVFINATRERAQTWFLDELCPMLNGKARVAAYVLGEPGAGKSTLLKYLINANASELAERNIVFSRFEFMKFIRRWLDANADVRFSLQRYLSFILLRDIIRTYGYRPFGPDRMARVDIGPFAKNVIKKTLLDAAALRNVVDGGLREALANAAVVIEGALLPDRLDAAQIKSVPHDIRVMIIDLFSRRAELALVVDGLDCISLEDSQFDTQRAEVMKTIDANRGRLTDFVLFDGDREQTFDVPSSTIFVMRENTFYFYNGGYVDIAGPDSPCFRVKEIEPDVAMYNAITRATDQWADAQGLSEEERRPTRRVLWVAVQLAVGSLGELMRLTDADRPKTRVVRRRARPVAAQDDTFLLALFGGNIRTAFKFLEQLLDWFLEDALTTGLLSLTPDTTVDEVVRMMVGHEGHRVLRKRNYRIMEVLLFGRGLWFENSVVSSPRGNFMAHAEKRLRDNAEFSGFLDNVFNYHILDQGGGGNDHCLLEKIRIIQILNGDCLTEQEIQERLAENIGYQPADLVNTLLVLVRSQMILVKVDQNAAHQFTASARGLICAMHMTRSMSYLEHVFHRTRFPKRLVQNVQDSYRSAGVEQWASWSIRNMYIFLAYLRFAEQNSACKKLGEAYKVYPRAQAGILDTVERMLQANQVDEDRADGEERWAALAREAERLMLNALSDWRRTGLVRGDDGDPLATEVA